ncbi:hypothetical protein [Sorangium sp. So ce542]|uniref:hypothetical protein n=1 Tax=Sorangium sp. So ce542 TaxID=3133316 RepID=UPI003F5DCEBC
MKKFARWALAFAAVTSISSSALAVDNYVRYSVALKNGVRNVDAGWGRFTFLDMDITPFGVGCLSVFTWYKPGLASAARTVINEQTAMADGDCELHSMMSSDTLIVDYFDPEIRNEGWDVRWQRKPVCKVAWVQDGKANVIKGLITLGNPMAPPYYATLTAVP